MRMLGWIAAALMFASSANGQALDPSMYCGKESCYDVLGVQLESTQKDIKRSYRSLSRKWHPDRVKGDDRAAATKKFAVIGVAYATLFDEEARKNYDHYLEHPELRNINEKDMFTYTYAPKSNLWGVLIGFILFTSGMQYFNATNNYKEMQERMRQDKRVLRRANALLDERAKGKPKAKGKVVKRKPSKKRHSQEDIDAAVEEVIATELKVEGSLATPPSWENTLLYYTITFPKWGSAFALENGMWIYKYKIMKSEYDDTAKVYLTQQALDIDAAAWGEKSDEERASLLGKELWNEENMATHKKEEMELYKKKNPAAYKRMVRSQKKGDAYNDKRSRRNMMGAGPPGSTLTPIAGD